MCSDGVKAGSHRCHILPVLWIQSAVQPSEAEINMRLGLDRFNLANDRFYEAHAGAKMHRVRQTFGQLIVQHSLPALKLQTPFVSLTLHDLIR